MTKRKITKRIESFIDINGCSIEQVIHLLTVFKNHHGENAIFLYDYCDDGYDIHLVTEREETDEEYKTRTDKEKEQRQKTIEYHQRQLEMLKTQNG